jgi:hypothetical protein
MTSLKGFSNILGMVGVFAILFVLPLVLPYIAYLLLAPVGFWQLTIFLILGIVLYFIALAKIWFIIYCFT